MRFVNKRASSRFETSKMICSYVRWLESTEEHMLKLLEGRKSRKRGRTKTPSGLELCIAYTEHKVAILLYH